MKRKNLNLFPLALTALLLTAMVATAMLRPARADAEPFHERVREAAAAIPYSIGNWVGEDREVPPAAVKLLKPNVLFNRLYQDMETGRAASLLLVQCQDARDLAGHYPPNCYRAHGWTQQGARPRDWNVAGTVIPGMEYEFTYTKEIDRQTNIIIANFMILPDGRITRDMDSVQKMAADYQRYFFGAAQIQLLISGDVPSAERDEIFAQIIGANQAVLAALRSGVVK